MRRFGRKVRKRRKEGEQGEGPPGEERAAGAEKKSEF